MTVADLRSAESVRHWFASTGHDQSTPESQERVLRILADFCTYVGKPPDELVGFCFLRKRAGSGSAASSAAWR